MGEDTDDAGEAYTGPMALADRFPATQHEDFRRLWAGSTLSSIGLWTIWIGNNWVVFDLSDSSAKVGLTTFAFMFGFLVAPLGGTVADRFERRQLSITIRIMTVGLNLGLLAMALTGLLSVWVIVAFSFFLGLANVVRDPTDQALLANVVPQRHIASAVTLISATRLGSRAVGPLLGAPLLLSVGPEGVYALGSVLSVAAIYSISRIQTVSRGGVAKLSQVVSNLGEGLSYVVRTPPVLSLFVLVSAHCALTMSYDGMLPGFVRDQFDGGSGTYTTLAVVVGTGALFGTTFLAGTTDMARGPLFLGTVVLSGRRAYPFSEQAPSFRW